MTKIQLRRDTLVNFTSKNPILAEGELAYETDTKKLKIGDGTTAYTSLAYFSTGGGGGTTDITASLPLKIVDGVISLEVDGQTIQIVDGKLHANLDELGNEVNSLTGEITDLSGRVTAVEADVLQKQDIIATNAPLQLIESSSIELQSDKLSYDNSTGILSYASGTHEDAAARIDLSRLHIKTHEPYTLHLRAARKQTTATGNSNFFRLQCYNDGTDTTFRGVRVWNGGGAGRAGGTNTVVKALILNSTDYVHYEFRYNGTSGISEYRGRNNNESDSTTLTINTFTDQAGDYSKFENEFTQLLLNCYYGYAGKFDLSQSYIEQNNVRYILKDVVAGGISTLQLNIGDGLSVTNGKLTATGGGSSEPPANMVTTDTAQTITGTKTFGNGKIILDGWIITPQDNVILKGGSLNEVYLGDRTGSTGIQGDIALYPTTQVKYKNTGDVFLHTANLGSYVDGTTITYTNNKLTASGGGSAPSNMVTTDTVQTITGSKTFTGANTFDKMVLPSDLDGVKGISLAGDGNASVYNAGNYLVLRKVNTITGGGGNLVLGDATIPTILRGSVVKTETNGKIYLTQGNVTAGDNVTITDTTDGIQISATGKLDIPVRYPVEVSDKSLMPSWYVVYNDGWIEQGGKIGATSTVVRVTLLKTFTNTNYSIIGSISGSNETLNIPRASDAKLADSFEFYTMRTGGEAYWKACGY